MNTPGRNPRPPAARRGLTLLEVMLALAILAGALAAINELSGMGSRSASRARDLTEAALICESKLAEITSGVYEPEPLANVPVEPDSPWLLSVELQSVGMVGAANIEGLAAVRVTVRQDPLRFPWPVEFSLVRWIADPGLELPEETAAEPEASTAGEAATGGGDGSS